MSSVNIIENHEVEYNVSLGLNEIITLLLSHHLLLTRHTELYTFFQKKLKFNSNNDDVIVHSNAQSEL